MLFHFLLLLNKKKKKYTPFPPAQQPSKVDLELESGAYFAKEHLKKRKESSMRAERESAKKPKVAKVSTPGKEPEHPLAKKSTM